MHLDETNHVVQKPTESTMLINGLKFLSRPLQAAFLLSLASCAVQPQWQMSPQWKYGPITKKQAEAAAIKEPLYQSSGGARYSLDHGPQAYPPHAGNPPQQHSKPQPYPGNNVQPSKYPHPSQRVISNQELVYLYGWLYNDPQKAASKLPLYAFSHPRGFQQYTVQAGDTFSQICQRAGLDRRVVWYYNWLYIQNAHVLVPGQVIRLPVF